MLTVGAEGIGGCRHSRSSAPQRAVAPPQNSNGDARDARTGQCTPDCSEVEFNFPWTISVNGQSSHSMNANRVSMAYPRAGEIEHWTYVNEGVRARRDPTALALAAKFPGVRMPYLQIHESDAADLISYIDAHSTRPQPTIALETLYALTTQDGTT